MTEKSNDNGKDVDPTVPDRKAHRVIEHSSSIYVVLAIIGAMMAMGLIWLVLVT